MQVVSYIVMVEVLPFWDWALSTVTVIRLKSS